MSALVSLAARPADRLSGCIVDARLALAPGGLVFALRLAHVGPVWLTRRFWSLIDGAYFYRSYPDELAPHRGHSAAATVEALVLWHTAWLHGALDGLFFWIGDARRESALPTNWSSDVISRYERLSAAFPVVNGAETAAPPGRAAHGLRPGGVRACRRPHNGRPDYPDGFAAARATAPDLHRSSRDRPYRRARADRMDSGCQLGRPHRAPEDQTAGRSIGISRHPYRCGAHACARCDVTAAVPAGRRHG